MGYHWTLLSYNDSETYIYYLPFYKGKFLFISFIYNEYLPFTSFYDGNVLFTV